MLHQRSVIFVLGLRRSRSCHFMQYSAWASSKISQSRTSADLFSALQLLCFLHCSHFVFEIRIFNKPSVLVVIRQYMTSNDTGERKRIVFTLTGCCALASHLLGAWEKCLFSLLYNLKICSMDWFHAGNFTHLVTPGQSNNILILLYLAGRQLRFIQSSCLQVAFFLSSLSSTLLFSKTSRSWCLTVNVPNEIQPVLIST